MENQTYCVLIKVSGRSLYRSRRNNKFSTLFRVNTRELALISVLSSLWIAAQVVLGPIIGQITNVHGVVQRLFGWFLMLILAEQTEKFGRVTLMATIAALATRMVRRTASIYPWVLAFGYSLGGLTFDLLFFMPFFHVSSLKGKVKTTYILTASLISGLFALIPYLAFQFYTLDINVFTVRLPIYAYSLLKGVSLSILGTFIGLPIASRIKPKELIS